MTMYVKNVKVMPGQNKYCSSKRKYLIDTRELQCRRIELK